MNEIVKQRIKDIESKADIVFADKTDFGKIDNCEETVNTNIIPADYVKVVRCKDCKKFRNNLCRKFMVSTELTDYWSYGERKDNNE